MRAQKLSREIDRLQTRYHELQYRRDRAFLRSEKKSRRNLEDQQDQVLREIYELNRALSRIESSETTSKLEGGKAEGLPIELGEKNKRAELYHPPDIDLAAWSRLEDFDAVLSGSIEVLDELYYVELVLYLRGQDERIVFFQEAFFPYESRELIEKITPRLRDLVYARDWADLLLRVRPREAEIYLDEKRGAPDNEGRLSFLEPGPHLLQVRAPGYVDRELGLSLESSRTKEIEVVLEKETPISLLVRSQPPGAEVYLNATPMGKTPLLLRELSSPAVLALQKENYRDIYRIYSGDSGELDISFPVRDEVFSELNGRAQDRVYRSLAGFFLTIPLTMLSYGQSSQYAYAHNSAMISGAEQSEIDRLHAASSLWYTAYLGGLFINAIFLTDSIISTGYYIKNSEQW